MQTRATVLVPTLGVLLGSLAAQLPGAAAQEVSRDVPYVPTPPAVVEAMLRTARVGPGDVVYDLGSGDGRIVISAARDFGARGIGYDIDPQRIREATANARSAGVDDRVRFVEQDLFETNLSEASVVTLYLLPTVNLRLRPKLLSELKPGTRVVSHAFDMDEWVPDQELNVDGRRVMYWVIPAQVDGTWEWSVPGEGSQRYRARLQQSFQQVSGAVDGPGVSNGIIRDPKLVGDQLSFTVVENRNGRETRARYQGKVEGGVIRGTVEVGGTSRPWTAQRSGPGVPRTQ